MNFLNLFSNTLSDKMDFNKIVHYYERIASTRKRLKIIDILAEMITTCRESENGKDLQKIIYLTQGKLASEIEDIPKFGIAEKMIIQTLVKFTGITPSRIKQKINELGDVGETVEFFLNKRISKKVSYSIDSFTKNSTNTLQVFEIRQLYKELTKLSQLKGEGSQDQKINIILGIIRRCSPQSAKFIVNIILSNLRIGLADMTIMDSLSLSFTGTKDNRKIIEKCYNIYPNLGKIAQILQEGGINALKQINIQVGVPIRMMLASRIQYPQIQAKFGGGDFMAEYKYDGERVQVHKSGNNVILFSRHMKNISKQYPDVVSAVQDEINAYEVIFEGEIVAMDPFFEKMLPFQVVSTRRRKFDITKIIKEVPVTLYCFDLLYLRFRREDESISSNFMDHSIEERRKHLELLFQPSDHLRFSNMKLIHSIDEMVKYFNEARAQGAEGIMNKKIGVGSIYNAGNRGFLWIKLKGLEGAKMLDTIDVVIIGGSWGKGRRKGVLSPLFGAVYNPETNNFEFITRIGSGFTDEDLIEITDILREYELKKPLKNILCKDKPDIWFEPKLIIEVMGDELTISNKSDAGSTLSDSNGYGLRFPIYQRTRYDKDVYQITTTNEIIDLYNKQSKK